MDVKLNSQNESNLDKMTANVLEQSEPMPEDSVVVKGIDFDKMWDLDTFLKSYYTTGFQATNLGIALDSLNEILELRQPMRLSSALRPRSELSQENATKFILEEGDVNDENKSTEEWSKVTIFLGYTSNLISSGLREIFVYLAKHKLIDVIVTSAGGVEEDLIKCMGDTYLGDFELKGSDLRQKGWNRIGNLLVPNNNYCAFEEWIMPVFDDCLKEQQERNYLWTPSKIISRLGKAVNDPTSLCYWCYKHGIPIFCPGLTDGSLGDMLYVHSYRNPGLVIDLVEDIRRINDLSLYSEQSAMLVLGGGVAKHHIYNANLMRNGADWCVHVSTGQEFDGCDSGARPDEAVSWGKIRYDGSSVKVYADATIVFPLLVAGTFAKFVEKHGESVRSLSQEIS